MMMTTEKRAMPTSDFPPEGLLLVDKPEGPTSHDVVARARRLTGQRRVGHAGTLDPMASGLLPLVLGRATRLVRFLPHEPKLYHGLLRLGLATTTDDVTGEVLSRHDGATPEPARVLEAAAALVGRVSQVTPRFSARKVDGRRLYHLARERRAVALPVQEVDVRRFELSPTERGDEWGLVAEVSAGTYIRGLCRDLGAALGTGGVLVALRRIGIGPLLLERAIPLPERDAPAWPGLPTALIGLDEMPLTPPPLRLTRGEDERRFASGSAVAVAAETDGYVRVLTDSGQLLGIGEGRNGVLKPRVVLFPGNVTLRG